MTDKIEQTADGGEIAYTPFSPETEKLIEFFQELFQHHWREITFGPCLNGAVYEIQLTSPPQSVVYKDGYLTIDTGPWHCHLCLGYPKGAPEILAKRRQVTRAVFFESRNKTCVPMSFGFRMWNGAGEQMISIFFPNPYLSDHLKSQKPPDWKRLQLWQSLKLKYTGDASLSLVPQDFLS